MFHRTADRVRAHVFLCMLAYYVEWHMRQRLKPLLFDDHDPAAAEAARTSILAPATGLRSRRGKKPAANAPLDGLPVHSFRTLLGDLATIVGNGRTFVVDLGFDHIGAERRGRSIMRLPSEGLQMLGIDANNVEDVIVTHLHYDHAGDLSAFPNAKIYLQDREMAFATGRHMGHQRMRHGLRRRVRVRFRSSRL